MNDIFQYLIICVVGTLGIIPLLLLPYAVTASEEELIQSLSFLGSEEELIQSNAILQEKNKYKDNFEIGIGSLFLGLPGLLLYWYTRS